MGRAPCCDKANVKKGPWSPEEDAKLKEYIDEYGTGGNWIALPQKAGLRRCGKSCRLRWLNYLRPNIKHGEFSDDEDRIICTLFANIGSRWSIIATHLPGRTDNDIKNYWNTKLKKKLMGIVSQSQREPQQPSFTSLLQSANIPSFTMSHNYYDGGSFVSPMQNYKVNDTNLFMFGGEASCSSSDGSCGNQISHGRDVEYEYGNGEQMGFQNYSNNSGMWGEVALNYSIEEIKQLISTNGNNNNNMFEENKGDDRIVFY